mmetsp:Transcript_17834/g.2477  ORF Transcript_17834/g.2477 Transcript_17834/m.2477 type:complete len:87 (+) Transcript_17834:32-292(+)
MSENQSDIRDQVQERNSVRSYFVDPVFFYNSLNRFSVVQGVHNFVSSAITTVANTLPFGVGTYGPTTRLEDNVRLSRYRSGQEDII